MRVLMLGWEFPPFIAGGLGVACYGLTRALDRLGHHVTFILPRAVDRSRADGVRVLGPEALAPIRLTPPSIAGPAGATSAGPGLASGAGDPGQNLMGFQHATFLAVPASFSSPYPPFEQAHFLPLGEDSPLMGGGVPPAPAAQGEPGGAGPARSAVPGVAMAPEANLRKIVGGFGVDLVGDAERYARLVVALASKEEFDVVHAHDWLTYPAGIAVSRVSGKPLLVHLHSTEFDRAGNNINQRIYDIERAGLQAASRVIAVSQFTRSICVRRYAVPASKVDVVYNGIEREALQPREGTRINGTDKIVLFMGRITMQKGPEYFIAAAKRVLEKMGNVRFVLAGSGDLAVRMIELAGSLGIGDKVLFTGFLRGEDVDRVLRMADCYVMPSVSEPFGLTALEAIQHDVPVIVSKTSGASEVLQHVLKVDFWDTDEMANKILAVLRHAPLSQSLRAGGAMELRRLTWEGAAQSCVTAYQTALAGAGATLTDGPGGTGLRAG